MHHSTRDYGSVEIRLLRILLCLKMNLKLILNLEIQIFKKVVIVEKSWFFEIRLKS